MRNIRFFEKQASLQQPALALCLLLALVAYLLMSRHSPEQVRNPPVRGPAVMQAPAPAPLEPREARLAGSIARDYRISLAVADRIVLAASKAAKDTHLPVSLVLAVAAIESGFRPTATSAKGAVGLMQVKPSIHRDVLQEGQETEIASNIHAGALILSTYLAQDKGRLIPALQHYNGNRKDRKARYAHKVLAKLKHYKEIVATNEDEEQSNEYEQ